LCPQCGRPLAYSTLADLVHHVRTDLSLPQLSRVVQLFARNIHDSTLPFNIQTMSAKLLLNLVEGIARKTSDVEGKGQSPHPSPPRTAATISWDARADGLVCAPIIDQQTD
jgi:hypothetical protein